MAFNFNWTPLTTKASSVFYDHAKSLLTQALNKPSKPPIIVDDIFVEELNLGQSAPELEILEIGDLAEDRFRGIFRMSYDGDAFLTLRTKVQVNPLNTYLSTTPSYTSPNPLAASSPLTIPLQITLSDFRLSGFVILVFSKAKGITIVFRNDPLDSLRVSSTFDSIPFIKDYLQREIERQVRALFQEELPVAIHRLSLRLWNPEYAASLEQESTPAAKPVFEDRYEDSEEQDDYSMNPLLVLPENGDPDAPLFSQKNMLRLASLMDSQKTLSLFTPNIRDAIFRCWASGSSNATVWDRMGSSSSEIPGTPSSYGFSDAGRSINSPTHLARPTLHTANSTLSASGHITPGRRKKKHRVVNLRKNKPSTETELDSSSTKTTGESKPAVEEGPTVQTTFHRRQREDSIDDSRPPTLRFHTSPIETAGSHSAPITEPPVPVTLVQGKEHGLPLRPPSPTESVATENITYLPTAPSHASEYSHRDEKRPQFRAGPKYSSGILERAFMAKLAGEMQRRIEEERMRKQGECAQWGVERELERLSDDVGPPPAYT